MKAGSLFAVLLAVADLTAFADAPPIISNLEKHDDTISMRFPLYPATQAYSLLNSTNLGPFVTTNTSFILRPFLVTNTVLGQPEYIIDNGSATFAGTWSTGTSSSDKYGTNYRFRSTPTGVNYAQFTPAIETAGDYHVYEWHPQGSNRTQSAPHVITHMGGSTTVYINQQTAGGTWNLLGRFNFAAGTSGNVRITDGFSNGVVLVDAIRFVGVGLPPKVTEVVSIGGYEWRGTDTAPHSAYRFRVTPMSSNEVLTATVLNRLAYGPTPHELERVLSTPNGADAYIDEQLSPELLVEDVSNSHTNIDLIAAKFADQDEPVSTNSHANISDFRAWHCLRAVGAKRQLLEVLLQFLENHFVTQFTKSRDYFAGKYNDGGLEDRLAAQLEYLENAKWRQALLNPACTFYDLLKISTESPAMILYLDTVESSGRGSNIPNENYARELLELFTFGVDNGYDQTDITLLSRAWTGWRLEMVDATNALNPFATKTTTILPGSTNTSLAYSNLLGCWAFNFQSFYRYTAGSTTIFANKTVPARFGSPYTTKTYGTNTVPGRYQLYLPQRSGTNGIRDGYDVIKHLADLPFTQEYISVKLCRLFVHDEFPNPSTDTSNPSYQFYNYAAGNLSAEAQLVRACMAAWESSSPKGQIRDVLRVIFDSELFRSQGAAFQKVKTPLEFVASAVRALRTSTNGFLPNTYTADTDGYALNTPLLRMGVMGLFDRGDPDGYPESAAGWISAGTLAERIRFAQSFSIAQGQSGHTGGQSGTGNDAGNNVLHPVTLILQKFPSQLDQKDAAKVVDYFLSLIYPGEGAGNLQLYREAAIEFLNTGDNGVDSPFASLSVSATSASPYDTRVRGMVGMLLAMQRFQEQ